MTPSNRSPRRRRLVLWLAAPAAAVAVAAGGWTAVTAASGEQAETRPVAAPTAEPTATAVPVSDRSAEDACRQIDRDDRLVMPQDWSDQDRVLDWATGWFSVSTSARFAEDPQMADAGAEIHDAIKGADGDLGESVLTLTQNEDAPPWSWIALSCVESGHIDMERFLELSDV